MTFLQFQTRVIQSTNISGVSAVITQFVKDSINQAYYDILRTADWPEATALGISINLATGVAAGPGFKYDLPSDFLKEDRIRYYANGAIVKNWQLREQKDTIPPAPIYGKPTYYIIVKGTATKYSIALEPSTGIDTVNDKLYVDYIEDPGPMGADGDLPISSLWDEEIVRRASIAILNYYAKPQQSQAVAATSVFAKEAPSSTKQPS